MTSIEASAVAGLAEGLVAVRYGAVQGEHERICHGNDDARYSMGGYGLVVKARPGYAFRYDICVDACRLVKLFHQPHTITVEFQADNQEDEDRLRSALKLNPHVVSVSE